MRKVLLLMGLSMLAVLMFVPMAWAQDGRSDNWTPPPSVNPTTGLATGALALLAGGGLFAASIARRTRQ